MEKIDITDKTLKVCVNCNKKYSFQESFYRSINYPDESLCDKCYSDALELVFCGLLNSVSEFKQGIEKEVELQEFKDAEISEGQNETGN